MTDLPMTPERALRTASFTLSVTTDATQAEQVLTIAAARGVDPADLAQLRAEWEDLIARTDVAIGGAK